MIALILANEYLQEGSSALRAMTEVSGKPVLQYQIESLVRSGVYNILIALPVYDRSVEAHFGDGKPFGAKIRYLKEERPLGSGGCFYLAAKVIHEDFFFLKGDLLLDVDFERLMKFHKRHEGVVTALTHPSRKPSEEDILMVNNQQRILHVLEAGKEREIYFENVVSAGIYVVSTALLETFDGLARPQKIDFEKELFEPSIYADGAYGYRSSEYVRKVEDVQIAQADIAKGTVAAKNLSRPQKAVFLDRDGVLNVFGDYVVRPDMLHLKPDAAAALKRINDSSYLAVCVTNQPVVARGEATIGMLKEIHNKLEDDLGEAGAYLDGLYCCPHFPGPLKEGENPEFKIACDCRKPGIGMLKKAEKDLHIDLKQSWMVGDTHQDVQTGINAGCRTILLTTGDPNPAKKFPEAKPDYVVKDLAEAVEIILSTDN